MERMGYAKGGLTLGSVSHGHSREKPHSLCWLAAIISMVFFSTTTGGRRALRGEINPGTSRAPPPPWAFVAARAKAMEDGFVDLGHQRRRRRRRRNIEE